MTDDLTAADREHAREWAKARGVEISHSKKFACWGFVLPADSPPDYGWEIVQRHAKVWECSESAAWDALALALRDLKRAVEIPGGGT